MKKIPNEFNYVLLSIIPSWAINITINKFTDKNIKHIKNSIFLRKEEKSILLLSIGGAANKMLTMMEVYPH